jgi:hypothetical protein
MLIESTKCSKHTSCLTFDLNIYDLFLFMCQPLWSHSLGWVDKGLDFAKRKEKRSGFELSNMCIIY